MFGPQALFSLSMRIVRGINVAIGWEKKNCYCDDFMHIWITLQVKWICLRWLYDDLTIVYGRNFNKSKTHKIIIISLNVS